LNSSVEYDRAKCEERIGENSIENGLTDWILRAKWWNDEKSSFWTCQSRTTVRGQVRTVRLVRTWSARSCVQQARPCALSWHSETQFFVFSRRFTLVF